MSALVGMPAQRVVRHIVKKNTSIQRVHFKIVAKSNWSLKNHGVIGGASLCRNDVLTDGIGCLISSMGEGQMLTIHSPVSVFQHRERPHIPMLDFKILRSEESSKLLAACLAERVAAGSLPKGVLLETERSYHYYGFGLLTEKEWRRFMAESLVYTPAGVHLVDCRWVGWRLLYGAAALRLNEKNPGLGVPTVICEIPER